jgi:hypothetical protein
VGGMRARLATLAVAIAFLTVGPDGAFGQERRLRCGLPDGTTVFQSYEVTAVRRAAGRDAIWACTRRGPARELQEVCEADCEAYAFAAKGPIFGLVLSISGRDEEDVEDLVYTWDVRTGRLRVELAASAGRVERLVVDGRGRAAWTSIDREGRIVVEAVGLRGNERELARARNVDRRLLAFRDGRARWRQAGQIRAQRVP